MAELHLANFVASFWFNISQVILGRIDPEILLLYSKSNVLNVHCYNEALCTKKLSEQLVW